MASFTVRIQKHHSRLLLTVLILTAGVKVFAYVCLMKEEHAIDDGAGQREEGMEEDKKEKWKRHHASENKGNFKKRKMCLKMCNNE